MLKVALAHLLRELFLGNGRATVVLAPIVNTLTAIVQAPVVVVAPPPAPVPALPAPSPAVATGPVAVGVLASMLFCIVPITCFSLLSLLLKCPRVLFAVVAMHEQNLLARTRLASGETCCLFQQRGG